MARKNTKKVKSANNRTISAQQLEKDFIQAPKTIATQLNKEIAALKQAEVKLKTAVTKLKAQIEKSKNRSFITTNTKKLRSLTKEWQDANASLATLAKKQSKMIALQKSISAFEKEWAKKIKLQKATKAVTKAKPRKPAKKTSNITPITTQLNSETSEKAQDNISLNQTSEAMS